MFARDDVHRGWRFPLAWIFLPLLLGALLVTGLGTAIQATQGFPDIELAERMQEEARVGDPLLAEATDGAVVKQLYLQRGLVGRPDAEGDCRTRADESTRL